MKTQTVVITHASGHTSRMQLVVEAELRQFSPDAAKAHGFVQKGELWVRELTDAAIKVEIMRTNFPTEAPLKGEMVKVGQCVSWSRK